jgi:hypothetical protein
MKKIVGLTIILCMVLTYNGVSVSSHEINEENFFKIEEIKVNNESQIYFTSTGPLALRITKITLLDGEPNQIQKLERIINMRILHYLRPFTIVPISDLNFSITYRRDLLFNRPKFSFATGVFEQVSENETESLLLTNIEHTAIVKEFNGFFLYSRAHLFRLRPVYHSARFMFFGSCEDTTILT